MDSVEASLVVCVRGHHAVSQQHQAGGEGEYDDGQPGPLRVSEHHHLHDTVCQQYQG